MNILDRSAQRRAIAEMVYNHFGPVIHRYEDIPEALLHDIADDGLEQGPPADIEHGLGTVARERAEALAKSARHDEDGIGVVRRFEQVFKGVKSNQLTGAIQQRQ